MRVTLLLTAVTAMALLSLSLRAADTAVTAEEPTPTAAPPASQPKDTEVEAEEVIRQLLLEPAKRAVLPDAPEAVATQPAVAPKALLRPLPMPPGAMLVNRLGTLRKDEASSWWMFHFESEKEVLYEPPIRVLPNRWLEAMETVLKKAAGRGVKFIISGEVTQYRDRRHVLIRKMIVKRDLGAL